MPVADMTVLQFFGNLAVAMACGFLIGLDRARNVGEVEDTTFGGIRTFPLIAILGALSMMIAPQTGTWFVGLVFAGLMGWIAISYYKDVQEGNVGLTTEVAALICFTCGVLCMIEGLLLIAVAVSIITTWLLTLKDNLHDFAEMVTTEDKVATLKFLIIAFVLLPLLPNETYSYTFTESLIPSWIGKDTLTINLINPAEVGWMVVLIAGISYLGFIASKMLGTKRGLGVSAFLGGLVSSTAVTLSFASRVKEYPSLLRTGVFAILIASATMYVRVLVEVMVVNPSFLPDVLKPVLFMAIIAFALCLFFYFKNDENGSDQEEEVELKNPFELSEALKFGALYGGIKLAAGLVYTLFENEGLYIVGFISGLTDMDAITLSVSRMVGQESNALVPFVGVTTIVLASISNSIVKGGLALKFGGRALGARVIGAFALTGLIGLLVLFLWR